MNPTLLVLAISDAQMDTPVVRIAPWAVVIGFLMKHYYETEVLEPLTFQGYEGALIPTLVANCEGNIYKETWYVR